MKITNKFNLPEALVKSVTYSGHRSADISVTELLSPFQLIMLRRKHDEDIEEDVTDRIYALQGNAMHYVLQKGAGANELAEQYLTADVDGVKISGMADLLDGDGCLWDYKTTSVWSVIYGDRKEEWTKQLNMYRLLYGKHGFEIKALKILVIMRDWTESKAGKDGYPINPVLVVDIPIMPDIEAFVTERVRLYKDALNGVLPPCTEAERWTKPTVYAVMKKGRKSALKLFDNDVEACIYAEGQGGYLEVRQGADTRCERYCPVNKWCEQYKNKVVE